MAQHELKTDKEVFQASWDERKYFEIRQDDRDFKTGDTLWLRETVHTGEEMKNGKPLEYTGRVIWVDVNYILKGQYGIKDGWCVMSVWVDGFEEDCYTSDL